MVSTFTLATFAALAKTAHAGTAINTEAVDAYSCGPLTQNIANADNFRSRMLQTAGFTAGQRWTDASVYSTDFIDSERPGGSGGADDIYFDNQYTSPAIAYFSGHGNCNDQTSTLCSTAATCPPLTGLQAVCMRYSEGGIFGVVGTCSYSVPRTLFTDQSGTSCTQVNYSSGPVAFGESPTRTFAGVGTNGGLNFAVLDVSCGITPGLEWLSVAAMSAGMSTVGSLMPTRYNDDTWDTSSRGRAWADRYIANPNSAIAVMWADAVNGTSDGGPCYFGGGYHGFGGCGAAIAISAEVSSSWALWANRYESWSQVQNDANDATGVGYYATIFTCNYDCNSHPINL